MKRHPFTESARFEQLLAAQRIAAAIEPEITNVITEDMQADRDADER